MINTNVQPSPSGNYPSVTVGGQKMKFISIPQLKELMRSLGLNQRERDYVLFVCQLENFAHSIDGVKGYAVETAEPYVGLGQFAEATWQALVDKDLLSIPYSYAGLPVADITAIVALFYDLQRSFLKHWPNRSSEDFTNELAYLYHNQGAKQARNYLYSGRLKWPQQSKTALRIMANAREVFRGISA